MTSNGATFEGLETTLSGIDPLFALFIGVVIGAIGVIVFLRWPSAPRKENDPLAGLFDGKTLDSQLTQIADPKTQSEREDRAAFAFRAKVFARKSAVAKAKDTTPPHRAERYDHAAVLAHVAKVMRAGTHLDESDHGVADAPAGEWEEVLLLPSPQKAESQEDEAKAA